MLVEPLSSRVGALLGGLLNEGCFNYPPVISQIDVGLGHKGLSLGFRCLSDNGLRRNRLYLNATDGNAFGPPPYPWPLLLSHPLFRVTEGTRTQRTCVLAPFLLFLLSYS